MRVGDYIRNENGLIGKIIGFKGDMVETDNKRLITYKSNHSECKIKERPIDLIEVGDYVNGLLVNEKYYDYANKEWKLNDRDGFICIEKDIKSIVTHEQFENMEYKL